jgi:hypothetical protein
MTNRISLIDIQPSQEDIDDAVKFCEAMRKVGLIEGLEWRLEVVEHWAAEVQESFDNGECQGI